MSRYLQGDDPMGIKLARSAMPEAAAVELKGGAVWRLRPAASLDVEMARAEAIRLFAGVLTGSQALSALAETFGDLFGLGEGADDARREAATQLLAEVTLALACSEGWQGVFDADGAPIAEPHAGAIALLLSDPVEAAKVRRVLNAGLHAEHDEKNASAASPSGGAAEAPAPVPTAAPVASAVPMA
jgi:hypothetical protein